MPKPTQLLGSDLSPLPEDCMLFFSSFFLQSPTCTAHQAGMMQVKKWSPQRSIMHSVSGRHWVTRATLKCLLPPPLVTGVQTLANFTLLV